MSINSDAADILEAAAFVIGTGHHAKGHYARTSNGLLSDLHAPDAHKWDVYAAMLCAQDSLAVSSWAFMAAINALQAEVRYINEWNDAPERTPAEVEAAMLKAAAKLRGEA